MKASSTNSAFIAGLLKKPFTLFFEKIEQLTNYKLVFFSYYILKKIIASRKRQKHYFKVKIVRKISLPNENTHRPKDFKLCLLKVLQIFFFHFEKINA